MFYGRAPHIKVRDVGCVLERFVLRAQFPWWRLGPLRARGEQHLGGAGPRQCRGGPGGRLVADLPQLEVRPPHEGAGQGDAAGQAGVARGPSDGALAQGGGQCAQ